MLTSGWPVYVLHVQRYTEFQKKYVKVNRRYKIYAKKKSPVLSETYTGYPDVHLLSSLKIYGIRY